jgi:hypothetical protein
MVLVICTELLRLVAQEAEVFREVVLVLQVDQEVLEV